MKLHRIKLGMIPTVAQSLILRFPVTWQSTLWHFSVIFLIISSTILKRFMMVSSLIRSFQWARSKIKLLTYFRKKCVLGNKHFHQYFRVTHTYTLRCSSPCVSLTVRANYCRYSMSNCETPLYRQKQGAILFWKRTQNHFPQNPSPIGIKFGMRHQGNEAFIDYAPSGSTLSNVAIELSTPKSVLFFKNLVRNYLAKCAEFDGGFWSMFICLVVLDMMIGLG